MILDQQAGDFCGKFFGCGDVVDWRRIMHIWCGGPPFDGNTARPRGAITLTSENGKTWLRVTDSYDDRMNER
ncbi:hypothetical protein BC936DRAFT_140953 [Jimgerdemannia flammicorona]|uniref:Uncharacterized protein n=1 Tax=Jimgerdemannia flammicorona TaxID=994334 RepID=A0A433A346_9FUNG|nr:hypothetical protein BC936DRAFT_140953 [Jimgerdemannia flammicorona]